MNKQDYKQPQMYSVEKNLWPRSLNNLLSRKRKTYQLGKEKEVKLVQDYNLK